MCSSRAKFSPASQDTKIQRIFALRTASTVEFSRSSRQEGYNFAIRRGTTISSPSRHASTPGKQKMRPKLRSDFCRKTSDTASDVRTRQSFWIVDVARQSQRSNAMKVAGNLEWLLSYELLLCHHERQIGYSMSRTDSAARRRELQNRLQLLIDGNDINYRGGV